LFGCHDPPAFLPDTTNLVCRTRSGYPNKSLPLSFVDTPKYSNPPRQLFLVSVDFGILFPMVMAERNDNGPNQEKSDIFKPSRFEPLYQPYFGFWLFAWSRCGQIVKKSSRKDSWYQDYSVLLTSAPPLCNRQPWAFVPEIARNI